ncbi:hypothetical protein Tco_1055331 [Tanacetum coccineum]|uniref:Uncharacterized protein n=1 Tax=Tanacetum coccineum TaxID=301880 RepID=A0ABQ5H0A6_9ASTR
MLEENYNKGHEDHKMAFEALQKSIIHDESEQFDADKAEERTKKKSKKDSPKILPGSPPPPRSSSTTTVFNNQSRLKPTASSVPEDVLMHEELDFKAQDMGSDDEDISSRHIPKASAIASSFVSPPENSLLSQTGDIGVFIDWFCKKQGITELTPEHLEGPAYEVLLTNQVDEGLLRYNVSRPLPLGGPLGQVTIQTEFFFNKDLEYLRFGHKGDKLAVSITKMKAASYPNAGLEQMVPDQMWAEEEYMYDISASYEHPSDTKVLTMKMEILLEPTSNKLLRTDKYGDSVGYTSYTGNPIKEIRLKMNLPYHRIKQKWRWRHLIPVKSIHHPMLSLNASKERHHVSN